MLLAEDLLLLLTDDETGRLTGSGMNVDVALGGAMLLELSMAGRVDLDARKRLAVLDPAATGDELLTEALGVVADREGKKPSAVIGKLGKGLRARLYERLTAAGILSAHEGTVLGIFPTSSWPARSAEHEAGVRRALASALVDENTPQPRDGALVALLHALRSTHEVVDPAQHGLSRRALDRRAKQIAEGDWASAAVRQSIDEMMAAVMVAVTAGAAIGGAGSG